MINSNSISCSYQNTGIFSHVFKTGISPAQCQLFCIYRLIFWHSSGLAGACTQSDHPSHKTALVNRVKMQVFRDIAAVTVQLIDWCCSCCNGITRPAESEKRARLPCRWCFTAVWTMWTVRPHNLHVHYLQPFSQSARIKYVNKIKYVLYWFFILFKYSFLKQQHTESERNVLKCFCGILW